MKNIKKSFNGVEVLKDISLKVEKGEVLGIIGPSGSGKSTLLRCATGLETADAGEIHYEGTFGLVFQNFNLFPHYSVMKNITDAPIKVQKRKKEEVYKEARELLKKMGLSDKENAYPCQLSGGQQQRVAIARALINKPRVLLLDEPLGALDLKLRKEMQIELKKIQQSLEITFVYVTHDQEEALTMSDTVAVMKDGDILQIGTPQDIYNEPKNAFIADFIGESNIIDGIMHADYSVEFAGYIFDCVDKGFESLEKVDVVIRPEDIIVIPPEDANISGLVESAIFKGVHYEMILDAHGYKWIIHSTEKWEEGSEIGIDIAKENIHIMKREVEEVLI